MARGRRRAVVSESSSDHEESLDLTEGGQGEEQEHSGGSSEEDNEDRFQPERFGVRLATEAQRQTWVRLAKLHIYPTRYPCQETMQVLGIYGDIMTLLNRIGWVRAVTGNWPTYPTLVYEMLSTLEVQRTPRQGPHTMTFRLCGQSHELTAADINKIFNVPPCSRFNDEMGVTMDSFWLQIQETQTSFNYKAAKSSMIANPVFRYLQKITSSTVLAHNETSGLRKFDLVILCGALEGANQNFGSILMQHLQRQATQATEAICIGGMITPIAEYLGLRPIRFERLPGERRIDLAHLRHTRMLASSTARHMFILRGKRYFPLPNPALTTVSDLVDRSNWLMNTPAHLALISGDVTAGQGRSEGGESSAQGARRGRRNREDVEDEQWTSLTETVSQIHNTVQNIQSDVTALRAQMQQFQTAPHGYPPHPGFFYPGQHFGAGAQEHQQQHPTSSSGGQYPPMYPYPYGYPYPYPPPPRPPPS